MATQDQVTSSTTTSLVTQPIVGATTGISPTTNATAVAGVDSPVNVYANVEKTDGVLGPGVNYTVVIQLPLPFLNLNLNLDLIGDFVLPALTALGVPQSVQWLQTNVMRLVNTVISDVQDLIKAIPESSVTIVIKLGPAVLVNIRLIAKKVPVIIPTPTFVLGLPNLGVDTNFNIGLPVPPGLTVVSEVPIPVPVIAYRPLVVITGGQVSANSTVTATPVPVANPLYLPKI